MRRKKKTGTSFASSETKTNETVLYARVSTKDQEKEGFSISAQQKLLRHYAEERGLKIMKEFTDVETARERGRPGFKAMAAFLKDNISCRSIIVEKTDRLYRNLPDYITLDELGLDIHFVKEGEVVSPHSHSSARFIHGIKVLMARNYSENLSEEARKGLLVKAEQGIWPRPAPTGYLNVIREDGKRVIVPDPEMAPRITRLFERYATGRYSISEAVTMVRDDGLLSIKSKKPLPKASIHRILSNRIYMGDFEFNGKIYRGIHKPLVTVDCWETVQDILNGRGHRRTRFSKYDYAFARLIRCGYCGCAVVGDRKKDRYMYYRCTHYKGQCPGKYSTEQALDKQFSEIIGRLALSDGLVERVRLALKQSLAKKTNYEKEVLESLQRQHTQATTRLTRNYEAWLDGDIDKALYEKKRDELTGQQSRMLRKIEAIQKAGRHYLDEGVRILELSQRARTLYEKQNQSEKRELLEIALSNCTLKDGIIEPTFRQPFNFIAELGKLEQKKKAVEGKFYGLSPLQRGGRDSNPRPPA